VTIRFILASKSPARLQTLRAAGVEPEVWVSHFDESQVTASSVPELAQNLATSKAMVIRDEVRGEALILGCDSILELDGEAFGKPSSFEDSIARWRQMSGRQGVLHTGHCLVDVAAERIVTSIASTFVHFAEVSDEEIELYCGTGEPANVAGGFTIDGFGGWFVDAVRGDHHNVVGLSLPVLRKMLRELGFSLADIGYPAF
jgi:septum formation protein